jgi:hypothetical protein
MHSRSTDYPTHSTTPWYQGRSTYTTARDDSTKDSFGSTTSSSSSSWSWSSPDITVKSFTTVIIPVAKKVYLEGTSSPTDYSVRFVCYSNLIPHVSANVSNMSLVIDSTADCDVTIRAYEFRNVHIESVNSLTTSDNLNGSQLSLKSSGVSEITLNNINYDVVEILLLNSSNVTLSGAAKRLDVFQVGMGVFDARSFSIDYAKVFTSNSNLIQIKSNNYLSLTVHGTANIIWCSPYVDIRIEETTSFTRPNIMYHCY